MRWFVPVVFAALTAACAQSPTGPSRSAPASSLGEIADQGGTPPPVAGDVFCGGSGQAACPGVGATRFLAFGDSLTWGVPSAFDAFDVLFVPPEPSDSYPRQLTSLLRAAYPVQQSAISMVNAGWPGELVTQSGTRARFQEAMSTYRPQAVLLLEGINDLNNSVGVTSTVSALSQLIDVARAYNATVLVATMFQTCRSEQPLADGTVRVRENAADQIPAFNSAVTAMAAGRINVHVVNLYGVFGTSNCTPTGGTGPLGRDGLHPNGSGYALIANKFRENISQIFVVRGTFQ